MKSQFYGSAGTPKSFWTWKSKKKRQNEKEIKFFNDVLIDKSLELEGFNNENEFIVIKVPNITDISFGRGVGYTFTEHDLGEEIHKISATNIRREMRENDELD